MDGEDLFQGAGFEDVVGPAFQLGGAGLLQAGFGLFVKQHPLEPGREVATESELLWQCQPIKKPK